MGIDPRESSDGVFHTTLNLNNWLPSLLRSEMIPNKTNKMQVIFFIFSNCLVGLLTEILVSSCILIFHLLAFPQL